VAQGDAYHTLLRSESTPLAEQHPAATVLLPTDRHGSVLLGLGDDHAGAANAYAPYGHNPTALSASGLAAFNGERLEPATQLYLLGNYRLYSTTLGRFLSADRLSPFEAGGVNSYAYCAGDPINYVDPTGHFKWLKNLFGRKANKVARIDRYNDKVKAYNSKIMNLKLERDYAGPGEGRLAAFQRNVLKIEAVGKPPRMLAAKDAQWAQKHGKALQPVAFNPETDAIKQMALQRLPDLAEAGKLLAAADYRRAVREASRVREPSRNPIDNNRSWLDTRKPGKRDEWQ